jgi:hypothetical protein
MLLLFYGCNDDMLSLSVILKCDLRNITFQIDWRIIDNVVFDNIGFKAVRVTSFQKIIAENETCGKDVARDGSF